MTSTLTDEHVKTSTTDQPAEAAHIVMVPRNQPDLTPQAYILRARVEGFPVTAICGHTWHPTKNPEPLPVCSSCLAIYQNDPHGHNDRDQLPEA